MSPTCLLVFAHTCADDQGGPGRHAASDQYEVLRTVSAAKGHCFRYESAIGHTSDHLPRLKRGLDNKPSAATPHMHSQALYLIYLRWFRRVGASPTYVRSGTLPERCNAFLRVRAAITLDALHEWGKRSPIAERIAYQRGRQVGRLLQPDFKRQIPDRPSPFKLLSGAPPIKRQCLRAMHRREANQGNMSRVHFSLACLSYNFPCQQA